MLARFRASSPDRCPQAAKSLCHAFGTRSGWWEKRQLFEAGRTRPLRLVKPEQKTSILQLFQWNSCNGNALQKILLLEKTVFNVRQKGVPPLLLPASVLQLPRCLVWICSLDSHDLTSFEWDSFKKMQLQQGKQAASTICSANVGYSPTPRQHF